MHILNIIINNTKKHSESAHDLCKNSLNNILDNNIDDILAKIIYTKSRLLKQNTTIKQPYIPQNNNIL